MGYQVLSKRPGGCVLPRAPRGRARLNQMPSPNSTPDNGRPQGQGPGQSSNRLKLEDGSRVAVIGGGPAGSFFCYFLLQMAGHAGLGIPGTFDEPRHFTHTGPAGCNHCGGVVSESLVQLLATEGISLPPSVVQRGIES